MSCRCVHVSPRRPAVFQIPSAVETMMQPLFTIRRNILVTTFLAALFFTHVRTPPRSVRRFICRCCGERAG